MANIFTVWRRLQTRRTELEGQIEFLKECRNKGITPQKARTRISVRTIRTSRALKACEKRVLAAMIQEKRSILDQTSYECYLEHLKLAKLVSKQDMDKYVTRIHFSMLRVSRHISKTHKLKLEGLFNKKLKETEEEIKPNLLPTKFHNFSKRVLSEKETKALGLGPKFCFKEKVNYNKTIAEIEAIISAVEPGQQEIVRGKMAETVIKYKQQTNHEKLEYKEEKKVLGDLKKDESIAIILTDKSGQIAILDKKEYSEKIMDHITSTGCTVVKRDPTKTIKSNINKLLKDPNFPPEIKKEVSIPAASSIPKMFGRIKTHKDNMPIRPVVVKCMSPTFTMEKVLTRLITPLFDDHPYTVKSTLEVINRLKKCKLKEGSRLISLDIVALFPSTPIDLALKLISDKLIEKGQYTLNQVGSIMKALRLITSTNYFVFDSKIYQQMSGAPMGSPISGLLAEVVLQYIENEAFKKLNFTPTHMVRYVDDCLLIIEETQNVDQIIAALESINSNIRYTKEEEDNGSIPFLDLIVTRDKDRITTKIYRKSIAPTQVIKEISSHPNPYKMSAFKWFSNRAELYCTHEEDKETEREHINKIASEHGYRHNDLPRRKNHNREETTLDKIGKEKKIKYRSMSYVRGLTERIGQIAKKYGVQVAQKCGGNLFNIIRKDRDNTKKLEKTGLYRIPIKNDKNEVMTRYLGLSSRMISERLKEHDRDVKKGNINNAISKFVTSNNKTYPDWANTEVLATNLNKTQLGYREGLEIQFSKVELCNQDPGWNINNVWKNILGNKTFTSNQQS